jgi:flagellar protein FlaJ
MASRRHRKKEAAAAAASAAPPPAPAPARGAAAPPPAAREPEVSEPVQANVRRARLWDRGGKPEGNTPDAGAPPRRPPRALPRIGLALAILALLDALWAGALLARGNLAGMVTLPWAAAFLALAALFPMKPAKVQPEAAKLRLVGLAIVNLVLLLALAAVEALAAFAALGLLFSFSQVAALFVQVFPVILAAFLATGAGLRILAGRWGVVLKVSRGRRALAALLAALALAVALTVLLAVLPAGRGVVELTVEQTPFLAAAGALLALLATWASSLPTFARIGDWLARQGLRNVRLARRLTYALAAPGLAVGLAGALAWRVVDPGLGVALLAAGLLLAMLAAYPAGVARWVPALGLEDPETFLRRRRAAVGGMLAAAALGIAGLALGALVEAAQLFEPDASPAPFLLAGAIALQALLSVAAVKVTLPGALGDARRTAAWNLSLFAVLLAFFGVLLGSGVAEGPGVGPGTGLLLLLGAGLASAGHHLLRAVLAPPRRAGKEQALRAAKPERDTKERIERSMHLAYVAGLGGTVALVGLVASTSLGVVDVEGSTGVPGWAFLLLGALLVAPVLGYAVWRFLQARKVEVEMRQQEAREYKKRISQQEATRLLLLGGSFTAAAVFSVFGLLTQFGVLKALGPFELTPKYSTDFFVFAILVGLGPFGFHRARQQARMRAIDQKFPEFLRDLAESKRAGMTLTQAVITASKGNYGVLTADIRKMAAQIEWGVGFAEALQRFAKRARTPLIERSVSLIVQASEAGGNVVDVLHAAAEDAREIQLLLKERKTSMSIYVMIIYIAFFVFLAVIAVLDAQFLPQVAKAVGGAQGVAVGPIKFGKIDVDAFEQVFFHAAIIQALGGGFVAGVMEEGKPIAGLRHVFIMVIFGYIAFRFVIGS